MLQHYRANLNQPKHQKILSPFNDEPDENIFEQVLLELPIPSSFRSTYRELKGIAINVLATLNTEFGACGQRMLLIGRALRWLGLLKYRPLDRKTIKLHFYIEFFVTNCQLSMEIIEKFMCFKLERYKGWRSFKAVVEWFPKFKFNFLGQKPSISKPWVDLWSFRRCIH